MQKTAAWPLAFIYAALIVYASLYPFENWRSQGVDWTAFLLAPWPKYWTGFDVLSNVLGYAPLGFVVALALRRSARHLPAVILSLLAGSLLALCMETMQLFLPARVPSNVDWELNTLGTFLGAICAWTLERFGFLDRWSRFRANWFAPDAKGSLVLLALWPVALLFPAPVPLGLGQVLERTEDALALYLQDTLWLDWLPVREVELQPLLPIYESLCVCLGLLIPCMLAFSLVRHFYQKAVAWGLLLGLGVGATALSAALTYGPVHAWGWINAPVQLALVVAALMAVPMMWLSEKMLQVLALVLLVLQLTMLNNASASAYFALTLQNWEQGQFIRFHGLIQWMGWLWPFVLLVYLMQCLSMTRTSKMSP
jgi:VanZ family protein